VLLFGIFVKMADDDTAAARETAKCRILLLLLLLFLLLLFISERWMNLWTLVKTDLTTKKESTTD
jgi:hypothetical protein